MNKITVYTQPSCGPCMTTKAHLAKLGLDYDEAAIQEQPAETVEAWKADGHTQAPIVHAIINGTNYVWSGYQRDNIRALSDLIREAA